MDDTELKKKTTPIDSMMARLEKDLPPKPPRIRVPQGATLRSQEGDDYIFNPPPPPLILPRDFTSEIDITDMEFNVTNENDTPVIDANENTRGYYRSDIPSYAPPAAAEDFGRRLAELEKLLAAKAPAQSNQASKTDAEVVEALHNIVLQFNKSMEVWYKETGCVVNLGWRYSPQKYLDVLGIDHIVFRKEAPSETTLKAAIERGSAKK